MTESNVCSKHM